MTRMQAARPRRAGLESNVPGFDAALLEDGQLYGLVVGIDPPEGRKLPAAELQQLRDPVAELLFERGTFPATTDELLRALDALNGDPAGLPHQRSYVVGEGGRIPVQAGDGTARSLRFAVTRASAPNVPPELLMSVGAGGDPRQRFLQVAGWDQTAGHFNFYLRNEGTTAWIWAGNSYHALEPRSRGKGPFDGHVNGSLVMKELKVPWSHWHSSRASIREAADEAVAADPLFADRAHADDFEASVIRPWVGRWTTRRLERMRAAGTIEHPDRLMRQVLTTTTANLVSTQTESARLAAGAPLRLPSTFFFNLDALEQLGVPVPPAVPVIPDGRLYADALAAVGSRLEDGRGFRSAGDTHFAFLVPEPALEDVTVVLRMASTGMVPARLLVAALMVDVANPTYSPRRAALMEPMPASADWGDGPTGLAERFAAGVTGPAGEAFLAIWQLDDDAWPQVCGEILTRYMQHVADRLATPDGVLDYLRLAVSRRRRFARTRLAEFPMLFPATDIPIDAPALELTLEGAVRPQEGA